MSRVGGAQVKKSDCAKRAVGEYGNETESNGIEKEKRDITVSERRVKIKFGTDKERS